MPRQQDSHKSNQDIDFHLPEIGLLWIRSHFQPLAISDSIHYFGNRLRRLILNHPNESQEPNSLHDNVSQMDQPDLKDDTYISSF